MHLQKLYWVAMNSASDVSSVSIHPDNSRFAVAQGSQVTLFRMKAILEEQEMLGYMRATKFHDDVFAAQEKRRQKKKKGRMEAPNAVPVAGAVTPAAASSSEEKQGGQNASDNAAANATTATTTTTSTTTTTTTAAGPQTTTTTTDTPASTSQNNSSNNNNTTTATTSQNQTTSNGDAANHDSNNNTTHRDDTTTNNNNDSDSESDQDDDDDNDDALSYEYKIGMERQIIENLQQQICNVQDHISDIHCVRFAPAAKPHLLATSSADGLVSIFQRVNTHSINLQSTTTGDDDESLESDADAQPDEEWNRYHLFRGHSRDVHGIEWSPDGKYLASCGVDNMIRIYDVDEKQEVRLLKESNGIVKSLAWDPVGTYLAAQVGDVRESILIFNARTWKLERELGDKYECFKLPSATGLFTQMSWSPNGQFLLTPAGRAGNSIVAPLFSRTNFDLLYMFRGHDTAVSVTSFNPVIFEDTKDSQDYTLYFAIGGCDNNVSVWSNKQKEPVAIVRYFGAPVTCLAWSTDGYTLLASSSDGSVNSICFSPEELGHALDKNRLKALLRKEYGDLSDYAHLLEEFDPSKTAVAPIRPKKNAQSGRGSSGARTKSTAAPASSAVNTLQIRRPDEETEEDLLNAVQLEEKSGSLKRPRESDVILQERYSKRLRLLEESQSTFSIRLQSIDAELKCTHSTQLGGQVSLIRLPGRETQWRINLKETPALAVSNHKFTAIATKERMLYIVSSQTGRHISPGMVNDSPVAFMACSQSDYLVIICDNCNMYAWNVSTQECILDITVFDLLTILKNRPQDVTNNYELISSLGITNEGTVVLTMFNGEAYAYDSLSWKSWVRVMDDNLCSAYKSLSMKIFSNQAFRRGNTLQKLSENEALESSKRPLSMQGDTHEEEDVETLLATANSLKDPQAYKNYARYYVEQATRKRLSEYFDELLMVEALRVSSAERLFSERKLAGVLDRRMVLGELLYHMKNKQLHSDLVNEYEKLLQRLWKIDCRPIDVESYRRLSGGEGSEAAGQQ